MTTVHEVRRLRIRPGPGSEGAALARRLTDVAHRLLGAELDEALAGLLPDDDRAEIAELRVRIELDPGELDEHVVAVLWAGLIRAEVAHRLGATTTGARPVDGSRAAPAPHETHPAAATPAARAAELAEALASTAAVGDAGAAELRALAARATDDAVTVEALALLAPHERAAALALLHAAGVTPSPALLGALGHPDRPDPGGDDVASRPPEGDHPRPGSARAPTATGREPSGTTPPGATRAIDDRSPHRAGAPGLSAYGGVVLLHHRLRLLLEAACAQAPGADPVAVRLDVLSVLVRPEPDPADPRPVRDDPLLRLLAGDPGWHDERPTPPAAVAADPAPGEAALAAFATDLPGFAGSSPGFVRAHWLERRALLVPDHGVVLVRLGRRPLDLVLDRLPYPVGALRLPWTPTILVGWEPG
ncbi:contractile injection system tape measure protein [Nocardioides sp.]|uniref:contractile injection system tape measure protein n=1 Tax=Nocardioides sp. TaxID=35761 RepID=UPI0026175EB0|nr:contractile injection system tape measure protein [Nocardioides sp.]MDI6911048.1 contractile injection system tape measure protein [Nocardioides sp.]